MWDPFGYLCTISLYIYLCKSNNCTNITGVWGITFAIGRLVGVTGPHSSWSLDDYNQELMDLRKATQGPICALVVIKLSFLLSTFLGLSQRG